MKLRLTNMLNDCFFVQVTKTFLDSSPPKISDEIDSEKLKELENLRQTIVESFGKFNR